MNRLTDDERDEILRLYPTLGIRAIAAQVGRSYSSARRVLVDAEVAMQPTGKPRPRKTASLS